MQKFTWEPIWLELKQQVPTLVSVMQCLLSKTFFEFFDVHYFEETMQAYVPAPKDHINLLYTNATNKQVMYHFTFC